MSESKRKTKNQLETELNSLQKEHQEVLDTLEAIRTGEVDAIVVDGKNGLQIYTLKRADQTFLTLVEEMAEGALTIATDGTIIYCNLSFSNLVAHPVEQIIGRSFFEFFDKEKSAQIKRIIIEQKHPSIRFETEIKGKTPPAIPVLLSLKKILIDSEELFTVILTDLREQKRKEELIAQGELVNAMMEMAKIGILVCDREGRVILSNAAADKIAGKVCISHPFSKIFKNMKLKRLSLSEKEEIPQLSLTEITTGKFKGVIGGEFVRSDGKFYDLSITVQDIRNEYDEVLGTLITLWDLKEQKKHIALLEISHEAFIVDSIKEFYQKIYDIIRPVICAEYFAIAIYNSRKENFDIVFKTKKLEYSGGNRILLQTLLKKTLETQKIQFLRYPEIQKLFSSIDEKSSPPQYTISVPLKIKNKILGVLIFQSYKQNFQFEEDEIEFLKIISEQIAIAMDRIRIHQENKFHHMVLKKVPYGVFLLDQNGKLIWANNAFSQMVDASLPELIGKYPPIYLDSTPFNKIFSDSIKTLKGDQTWESELIIMKERNEGFPIGTIFSTIEGSDDRITRYLGIVQDISEKKELEQQLFQAQKMEAIGKLAGGVAHDFNNILTVINGFSDMLLAQIDREHPFYKPIETIRKAGDRASSLTNQLLAFSRKQVIQPQNLNLNTVVRDTEKMLKRLIGEDVELKTKLDPQLAEIRIDPSQIDQIIMNLAVNARDAMPKGGKLTIETRNVELDSTYIQNHEIVKPGKYVLLAVSDTGIGIPREIQKHIFEPFFTTKGKGQGTGLGLSTVYGIVKQNSGYIWVYSEPGKGTTFKIYFPAIFSTTESSTPERIIDKDLTGNETILLVEDDPWVRELTLATLTAFGYQVIDTQSPEEALEICKNSDQPIHLLFTDVVMPGMGGKDLAQKIKEIRPDIKILYMSGYTDDAILRYGISQQKVDFIQKPFSSSALARKVREVLDK